MTNNLYIPLTDRALLAISGEDARQFLQGLITNDINKVNSTNAIYALMLTPQGKFLYDFFITEHKDGLTLDCNASKLDEIKKKLAMYKLRSKVVIDDISNEYEVVALIGGNIEGIFKYPDPRSRNLPIRATIKKSNDYSELESNGLTQGNIADYEKSRINLCIPSDGDMENAFPLEYEMDTHNAIDYEKGCYVGQEVTARTHYRGTLRKKPYMVTAEDGIDLSKYKDEEIISAGNKIGIMRGSSGNIGLALIRVEDLEKSCGDVMVSELKVTLGTP